MKKYSLFLILFIFTLSACDPFHNVIEKESDEKTAIYYEAKNIVSPSETPTLKFVTWNVKFGGGRIDFFFDCYGDRVLMSAEEVKTNMKGLTDQIKLMDPDIIVVQEIDIDSKRTAYIDQVQQILDNTDLNYAVYASQWKSDYVPSDGIGRINSGNAIFSKYKLTDAKRTALPLISEQSGVVQYFYLRRNILNATADVNGKEIIIYDTHTAAFAQDGTRQKQLSLIKEAVDKVNAAGKNFILAGDFNTIPPKSVKFDNFDDDKCGESSDFDTPSFEPDLNILQPYYDSYEAAISQARYEADNSKYFSHTTNKNGFWNRKLDYIFTNGDFIDNSGKVHQTADAGGVELMKLSDHAPVSVTYTIAGVKK